MLPRQLFPVCLHLCLVAFQIQKLDGLAVGDPDRTPVLAEGEAEGPSEDIIDKEISYDEQVEPLVHDDRDLLIDELNPDHLESEHFPGDMFNPMSSIFSEVKGDLTLITWRHAVNSQAKLTAALNSTAMMLEADVIIGTLSGDPNHVELPVMGHPPDVESDISLDQFIERVSSSQTHKGIKLDFKSIEAFSKSRAVLQKYSGSLDIPLWLNADILPGPVSPSTPPVSADLFLNTSVTEYPDDMLSIGWTTHYAPHGKYTLDDHIEPMLKALNRNKVLKPVTFPVRAVFATESIDLLVYLVATSPPGSSLTVWMSNDSDPVNIPRLRGLISAVGRDKVFLDLPQFVMDRLRSEGDDPSGGCSLRSSVLLTCVTLAVAAVSWCLQH